MDVGSQIRALRDQPYDLLVAMERRTRGGLAVQAETVATDREWVGVAWRIAGESFLSAREETREVLPLPTPLTRVPGAKPWVLGLANLRGSLLPVIDLRQFLGGGNTALSRNTRLLVVNHREIPAALVVDEVHGFRRFADAEYSGHAPATLLPCERYLAGSFKRGIDVWPVLGLRRLVESQGFLDAAH